MGAFEQAVKQLLESELMCPKCQAGNVGKASRLVTINDRGRGECACCGHEWPLKGPR